MKRIAFAAVLLLVLTGCGVQPTDVVLAGQGPDGIARGPVLYFVTGEPGQVRPSIRETGRLGTVTDALRLLAAGPTDAEGAAGLRTELPFLTTEQVSAGAPDAGIVTVQLPVPPSTLSELASTQLICTAVRVSAMAGANAQKLMVRLSGSGEIGKPLLCPATR
ncbi:hypothetical protein AB0I53_26815 [Saccharopolyspora sp. NPDC050389]|uniref:hypothetical protein n=1 Tax=Saccharopolyspora sp. NPDC050389 TaxID=3155516 RepID=UPI0033C2155D